MLGMITSAIMARILLKDDVAAYRQTFLAYATLSPLLTMGVGQGMYYFLPAEDKRIRGRIVDGMLILGVLGFVFALFLMLGGNELLARRFSNPKVARMLLWMIPFAIITTPASIASRVLVARDRVAIASVLGVVRQLFVGVVTIIPLLIWNTSEAALIGNVVAGVLMAAAAITLILRVVPQDSIRPSVKGIKELLMFGVPIGLASAVGTLNRQLDKMVVGFMDTPDNFAEFSFGALEIPLLGMITGSVTAVMLTDLRKAVAAGDTREALRLFRLTSEKTSLVLFPILFFFLVCADDFISVLYTDDYAGAAVPFRWYLGVLPIKTAYFTSLCMALGMSRFMLLRASGSLAMNLILSIALVSLLGSTGAAISTVAVKYIWAVPISFYVVCKALECRWRDVLPFRYLGTVAMQIAPVSIAAFLCASQFSSPLLRLAITATIFAGFLVYWWNGRLYSAASVVAYLKSSI